MGRGGTGCGACVVGRRGRSLLLDPASPGELRSRHPHPLLLWLSCPARRCQGDLPERGRGGEREGKVLTETSLLMNQPRFVSSLLWKGALPAASPSPQREQLPEKTPRPKTCYPKHSGHELESGETPRVPTLKHPELKIAVRNFSINQSVLRCFPPCYPPVSL